MTKITRGCGDSTYSILFDNGDSSMQTVNIDGYPIGILNILMDKEAKSIDISYHSLSYNEDGIFNATRIIERQIDRYRKEGYRIFRTTIAEHDKQLIDIYSGILFKETGHKIIYKNGSKVRKLIDYDLILND